MTNSESSATLADILDTLRRGTDCVVLRNFEGLPDKWGNDVDLLVAPECHAKAVQLVGQRLWVNGLADRTSVMVRFGLTAFYVKAADRDLRIDLFSMLSKAWIEYADVGVVLRAKRAFSELFDVPCPNHVALLIAAKELFAYGKVRMKYHDLGQSIRDGELRADAQSLFRGRIPQRSIDLITDVLTARRSGGSLRPAVSSLMRPCAIARWLRLRRSCFVPFVPDGGADL